ncbi:MAG: hypothetical protein EPN75_07855 [Beijerinckiaceae bacterium]|nr:MAG: hypothetical protein EPN75_07855 [Beijerinckiaceae bacterium]
MTNGILVTLAVGFAGTLIGAVSAIVVALIDRQPSLAATVDAHIGVLIEIYERTIGELRAEIGRLEEKIDYYEKTISDLRDHIDKLEGKIDVLQSRLKEASATAL